jgi:hypothetical protein
MSHFRTVAVAWILLVLVIGCKSSTSPNDGGDGTQNLPDSVRLVLKKSGVDTLTGKPNSSLSIEFTVTRAGKAVDSAVVGYYHPITAMSLISDMTVAGKATVIIDIPATTTSGDYPVSFSASKRDVPRSDTIRMVVHVDGRADLKMDLRARGESSGIGLTWTRTTSDTKADTAYLESSTGAVVAESVVAAPTANAHFTGLHEGEIYTLHVNSFEAISEQVHWALSKRYGPVRVYEGLGLDLSTGDVTTVTGDADQSDLVLATDASSAAFMSIVSPSLTELTGLAHGRATHISDFYTYGQSLDSLYYLKDLSNRFDSDVTAIQLDFESHPSLIFQVVTADGNYAQVGIIPQPDGRLIGVGADNKRFVDFRVSYQSLANLPYAGRAFEHRTIKKFGRLLQ